MITKTEWNCGWFHLIIGNVLGEDVGMLVVLFVEH